MEDQGSMRDTCSQVQAQTVPRWKLVALSLSVWQDDTHPQLFESFYTSIYKPHVSLFQNM
jgi:hypothetical protein